MTIGTKFQPVLTALITITEGIENIFAITGSGGPYQEIEALCSFDLIYSCSRDKTTIEIRNY